MGILKKKRTLEQVKEKSKQGVEEKEDADN